MPGRGRDDPSSAALQVASLPSYLFPQPSARVRARTLTKPGPLLSRFPVCNIVYTQTLEQVWTVVEKDLEANLLIFLEQLFALEPSVADALQKIDQRRRTQKPKAEENKAGNNATSPLAVQIKLVASHFGRVLRAALCDSPSPGGEGSGQPWQKLAPGFRSLAQSLASHGWGIDFISSVGSAAELALRAILREQWVEVEGSWWPKMWSLVQGEMETQLRFDMAAAQHGLDTARKMTLEVASSPSSGQSTELKTVFESACQVLMLRGAGEEVRQWQAARVSLLQLESTHGHFGLALAVDGEKEEGVTHAVEAASPETRQIDSTSVRLSWRPPCPSNRDLDTHNSQTSALEFSVRFEDALSCSNLINAITLAQDLAFGRSQAKRGHNGRDSVRMEHVIDAPKLVNALSTQSNNFWEAALCQLGDVTTSTRPPQLSPSLSPVDRASAIHDREEEQSRDVEVSHRPQSLRGSPVATSQDGTPSSARSQNLLTMWPFVDRLDLKNGNKTLNRHAPLAHSSAEQTIAPVARGPYSQHRLLDSKGKDENSRDVDDSRCNKDGGNKTSTRAVDADPCANDKKEELTKTEQTRKQEQNATIKQTCVVQAEAKTERTLPRRLANVSPESTRLHLSNQVPPARTHDAKSSDSSGDMLAEVMLLSPEGIHQLTSVDEVKAQLEKIESLLKGVNDKQSQQGVSIDSNDTANAPKERDQEIKWASLVNNLQGRKRAADAITSNHVSKGVKDDAVGITEGAKDDGFKRRFSKDKETAPWTSGSSVVVREVEEAPQKPSNGSAHAGTLTNSQLAMVPGLEGEEDNCKKKGRTQDQEPESQPRAQAHSLPARAREENLRIGEIEGRRRGNGHRSHSLELERPTQRAGRRSPTASLDLPREKMKVYRSWHSLAKSDGTSVDRASSSLAQSPIWRRRMAASSSVLSRIRATRSESDLLASQAESSDSAPASDSFASDFNKPFPYTNARYIPQVDIVEDGLPPVPRAVAAQRHLEVMLLIKEVKHLPERRDGLSDSDITIYCVSISLNDEAQSAVQTQARRGSVQDGCKWYERFSIHVPEELLKEARIASLEERPGPVFSLDLHDSGKYSTDVSIGKAQIAVKDILDLVEDGLVVSTTLQGPDGEYVMGLDGKQTCLELMFHTLLANLQEDWVPPAMRDTLASCDEERIVLNPARNPFYSGKQSSALNSSIFNFGASTGTTEKGDGASEFTQAWMYPQDDEEASNADDEEIFVSGSKHRTIDYHWRERLETVMDSLAVNLLVICLVIIDIVNIIVFTVVIRTPDYEDDPLPSFILQIFVIACLLIELTLRQTAIGRRFWKSWSNIFDAVVVYLSLIIFITRQTVKSSSIKQFKGLVALRALRAVAVALRVVRVLINLRRARKLSGHVAKKLRSTVSQNKRRYKKHGFDLDLTYITNRVIAMGTPAFGKHSSYRNDIHVVSRFMAFRHYGCFLIFNLCDTYTSSDGMTGNYNPDMLFNQVQRIPFEDHMPPLMSEMFQFCEEASMWLMKDPRNVVAVHCKGGKGRSGVMTSALILWTGHRKCALDALELFTFRRTVNYNAELGLDGNYQKNAFQIARNPANQTVEGPSQIRYVHYLEAVLYSGVDPLEMHRVLLTAISLPVGEIQVNQPLHISVMVRCLRYPVFDSCNNDVETVWTLTGEEGKVITFPINCIVWGDVRVEIFRHKTQLKSSARKLFAFCVFNTAFYKEETSITFQKSKLDVINKDRANLIVNGDFYMTMRFDPHSDHELLRLDAKTRQVFFQYGNRIVLQAGDAVVRSGNTEDHIYLLSSGSLEGVVDEHNLVDSHFHHPLGRSAAQVCSLGKGSISGDCTRVPNVCILGAGRLCGDSQFLNGAPSMHYRARTECELYSLSRHPDGLQSGDLSVQNVPEEELADFYRGMSIMLGTRLSRIRIEAIRLGSLKALNDRQTVLAHLHESEKLRIACISMFGLPMNEKLVARSKCACTSPETHDHTKRMRMIILVKYIILDPEFFGPDISPQSEIWPLRRLCSVSPAENNASTSLQVTLLGERVHGLDIAANTVEYTFAFNDSFQTRQIYHQLSSMCKKAEEKRERERQRPFETPIMSSLLEKCSVVHRIRKGEKLRQASSNSSLFLVCTGEIRLQVKGGDVFRIVGEGACFGEINFALNCTAGHYMCIANARTILLEISHTQLHRTVKHDHKLRARFFYIFCQAIEREIRETLEEIFPGSWSRKLSPHTLASAQPQTSHVDALSATTGLHTPRIFSPSAQSDRQRKSSERPSRLNLVSKTMGALGKIGNLSRPSSKAEHSPRKRSEQKSAQAHGSLPRLDLSSRSPGRVILQPSPSAARLHDEATSVI